MPFVRPLKLVSATDASAEPLLQDLNERMARYYNAPERQAYFARLNPEHETWDDSPFHQVIRDLVGPGMRVLDLGCGPGRACLEMRGRDIRYTGVDWSAEQIRDNQRRLGDEATFVAASLYESGLPDDSFDFVMTLYVLEHLVWPHRFLREMVRITRPGGRLAILCPHFRAFNRIPSLHYGRRPAPLGRRIRSGRLLGAARHLALRNWIYPRLIRRKFDRHHHPFLINLDPSCLHGDYYIDNDAVYLTERDEIVSELAAAGAVDITTEALASANPPVPAATDTLLVIAQKTVAG